MLEHQERQVHLITGKGGVGKTFAACALARCFANRGHTVLLAELNTGDRIARSLQVPASNGELMRLDERLSYVDIKPAAAMREYALMRLKWQSLYRLVFENRIVKHFLQAIPGLAELVMLGKLAYHADQKTKGVPRFERIVIDAPATGHAISLLATPAIVLRSIPRGPLADAVRLSQQLLVDAERFRVHIVAAPEELPVNETLELKSELEQRHIPIGWLILNHCRTSFEVALSQAHDVDPALAAHLQHQLYHLESQRIQKERLALSWRPADICFPTMLPARDDQLATAMDGETQAQLVTSAAALFEEAFHERCCRP